MSFSDNIIKMRKDNSLTQEQLAEELNVSRQAVSKWERGIGYPETEKILYICSTYGISMDTLFAEEIGACCDGGKKSPAEKDFFEQLSSWWSNLSVRDRRGCKIIAGIFLFLIMADMTYELGYHFGGFLYNLFH